MHKEGANIFVKDSKGNIIPNSCELCSEFSVYGRNNKWYCLQHWIDSNIWKEQDLLGG